MKNITNDIIYLDNAATTRCDPRVVDAMAPFWFENYGNPSSPHIFGRTALEAIENSREEILSLLRGAGDIVFTGGATESNNLGIYSLIRSAKELGNRKRILCLSTEHKSIVNSVTYFSGKMGMVVESVPVSASGLADMEWLKQRLDETVGAVVVQLANSETGVIQDVKTIVKLSHAVGAKCFSDITQCIGKMAIDLNELEVDYASFAGHKFHGPKGTGALYVSRGASISPLIFGGGQERGVRPGTENVAGIVGLSTALSIGVHEMQETRQNIGVLRESFWDELKQLGDINWNGRQAPLLPSHLNVTIRGVNAQDMMLRARNVVFSAGSACNTLSNAPSPVLLAMGLTRDAAEQTVRFTFSKYNTSQQIVMAANELTTIIQTMRIGI